MDRFPKELFKKCGDLLEKLMKHLYGWVFNEPVDPKKLNLHDYFVVIKHPMDLGTVKKKLSKNWYKTPEEFAEDVRLTFNNAMTYNEKGQDVHTMADVLLKIFEEGWATIKAKFSFDERPEMGYDASLPTPTSKRTIAPQAPARASDPTPARMPTPASPPRPMPLETRALDRSESMTVPVGLRSEDTYNTANPGKTSALKKPKTKDLEKREMTYEEKQSLSTNLQNLPSEELEIVVQIIRKRNPGLFQQEDEIEVDINSFDLETLWELHRFVTSCQNNRKAEFALQARQDADHIIQDNNLASTTAKLSKEPRSVEKTASRSPFQGGRQGDNVSGSSSSSSDSGSSSSDSHSGSSSGNESGAGH